MAPSDLDQAYQQVRMAHQANKRKMPLAAKSNLKTANAYISRAKILKKGYTMDRTDPFEISKAFASQSETLKRISGMKVDKIPQQAKQSSKVATALKTASVVKKNYSFAVVDDYDMDEIAKVAGGRAFAAAAGQAGRAMSGAGKSIGAGNFSGGMKMAGSGMKKAGKLSAIGTKQMGGAVGSKIGGMSFGSKVGLAAGGTLAAGGAGAYAGNKFGKSAFFEEPIEKAFAGGGLKAFKPAVMANSTHGIAGSLAKKPAMTNQAQKTAAAMRRGAGY